MQVVSGDGVAEFIEQKLGIKISLPRIALGYVADDGRPLCGVVLNDYTEGANVELTMFAERGCITRGVLRHLSDFVFNQLKCVRVTARTKRKNKIVRKLIMRYGFKFEGVARKFYGDQDAMVYGMLKDECRWLK